jgi:hypothetical protein
MTVLSRESVRFRRFVIDALWTKASFGYIDADWFLGECPICGLPVGVRFAGRAPRASLNCHGGCDEAAIAAAIGLEVRP